MTCSKFRENDKKRLKFILPVILKMSYEGFRKLGFISLEEISETSVKPGFIITDIKDDNIPVKAAKIQNLDAWRNFDIDFGIMEFLSKEKYYFPTDIQRKVLENKSLHNSINVVTSPTGSGKTLAYLIPILNEVIKQKVPNGIFCIIVSPTRDLTLQLKDLISKILRNSSSKAKAAALCNGIYSEKQERILKRGFQILVLTPGKFKEVFSNFESLDLAKYFVIDEADRILDRSKSTYKDLAYWFKKPGRPSFSSYFLVSSTLTKEFVLDSGIFSLDTSLNFFSDSFANHQIFDILHYVLEDDKCSALLNIIKNSQFKKVIIFSNLRPDLYFISFLLKYFLFENKIIESGLRLGRRNKFINNLAKIEKMVLLSTDLLARGIDFYNFDCVIHYSFPTDYETFIHRRGRVGRQSSGNNILFCTPGDSPKVIDKIIKNLGPKLDYCTSNKDLMELKNLIGILKRGYSFQKDARNYTKKDL
jgi:superfamily II DNA/RNA helicase